MSAFHIEYPQPLRQSFILSRSLCMSYAFLYLTTRCPSTRSISRSLFTITQSTSSRVLRQLSDRPVEMDTNALFARNNALNINPNIGGRADISITTHGSDFYYAICTVMGVTALTVMGLSFLKPQSDRIFFYITAAINATACIAYFSMGSNLGQVPITAEFQRNDPIVRGVTREIFYARYIDWFVTTPLLLMDLLLTAGMPWPSILWTIFLDEIMIVTGLLGALTRTRYKFGKQLWLNL